MSETRTIRFWDFRARWRDLLRDRDRPMRTAFAFALGAFIGSTPILGVHTWAAVGAATLLRLPPLAVVLGSNLSNPISFVPITLLEVRIGSWMLGRDFHAVPESFTAADISSYVVEAWVGWPVVGLLFALLSFVAVAGALRRAQSMRQSR